VGSGADAGAETDRLIRLAEDLLLLARADNHQPFLRPRRLSVPDLLQAAARGAATRGAERAVTVAVHVPAPVRIARATARTAITVHVTGREVGGGQRAGPFPDVPDRSRPR
jgi:signal transduction histidine kinase